MPKPKSNRTAHKTRKCPPPVSSLTPPPTTPLQSTCRSPSPSFLDGRSYAQAASTPLRLRTPSVPTTTPMPALPSPVPRAEPTVSPNTADPVATPTLIQQDMGDNGGENAAHRGDNPAGLVIRIPPTHQRTATPEYVAMGTPSSLARWETRSSFSHQGPLWAPTPEGERSLTVDMSSPGNDEEAVTAGWDPDAMPVTANGKTSDESHPPPKQHPSRTASKRPWLGSSSVEEQSWETPAQCRRTMQPQSQPRMPASMPIPNPWVSQSRSHAPAPGPLGRDTSLDVSTPRGPPQTLETHVQSTADLEAHETTTIPAPQPTMNHCWNSLLDPTPPGENLHNTDAMDTDIPDRNQEREGPRNATPGPSTGLYPHLSPTIEDDVDAMYDGPPLPGIIPRQCAGPHPAHTGAHPRNDTPRPPLRDTLSPPPWRSYAPASTHPAATPGAPPPSLGRSAPPALNQAPLYHLPWLQGTWGNTQPLLCIPEVPPTALERHTAEATLLAPPEILPEAVETGEEGDLLVTPIPDDGYPIVHHDDPEAHLRGLSRGWQRRMWTDPPGTVIFIQVG